MLTTYIPYRRRWRYVCRTSRTFPHLTFSLDVAVCIFDQTIVQAFKTPRITLEPPQFVPQNFEPLDRIPTVSSVVRELDMQPDVEAENTLRNHLLIGLCESNVGKYSYYHENAIYTKGYDHPEARRLAFM